MCSRRPGPGLCTCPLSHTAPGGPLSPASSRVWTRRVCVHTQLISALQGRVMVIPTIYEKLRLGQEGHRPRSGQAVAQTRVSGHPDQGSFQITQRNFIQQVFTAFRLRARHCPRLQRQWAAKQTSASQSECFPCIRAQPTGLPWWPSG